MYNFFCGLHDTHVHIICSVPDVTHVRKCGAIAATNLLFLPSVVPTAFSTIQQKLLVAVPSTYRQYGTVTVMGFNGASHFSHNFARNEGGAVLTANSVLYLTSLELTTSSTTRQAMVVQSLQQSTHY